MDLNLETCVMVFLIGFALYLLTNNVLNVEGVADLSSPPTKTIKWDKNNPPDKIKCKSWWGGDMLKYHPGQRQCSDLNPEKDTDFYYYSINTQGYPGSCFTVDYGEEFVIDRQNTCCINSFGKGQHPSQCWVEVPQ
jgi:hypothetical protein